MAKVAIAAIQTGNAPPGAPLAVPIGLLHRPEIFVSSRQSHRFSSLQYLGIPGFHCSWLSIVCLKCDIGFLIDSYCLRIMCQRECESSQ